MEPTAESRLSALVRSFASGLAKHSRTEPVALTGAPPAGLVLEEEGDVLRLGFDRKRRSERDVDLVL